MKKSRLHLSVIITCFLLYLFLFSLTQLCEAQELGLEGVNIERAYGWIKSQIDTTTNLVSSFSNLPRTDPSYEVTWMYNQAQAIQAALVFDDITTAEQLAKGALDLKRNNGAWRNAYMTNSGMMASRLSEQMVSWTGPNMAMGHALLNLLERTSDEALTRDLMSASIGLTRWLDGIDYDTDDTVVAVGPDRRFVAVGPDKPYEVWTEHNQRAFAFYYQLYNQFQDKNHKNKVVLAIYNDSLDVAELKERGDQIINWVQEEMFDGERYLYGYSDVRTDRGFLDSELVQWAYPQYLAPIMANIAGLDPEEFSGGLDWALERQSEFMIEGQTYRGIPRWTWFYLRRPSLWGKGTSETIVALKLLGRDEEVEQLIATLAVLQDSSGGILAAVGDASQGWPINFPYPSVEATSPVIVAIGKFNPNFIAFEGINDSSSIRGIFPFKNHILLQ